MIKPNEKIFDYMKLRLSNVSNILLDLLIITSSIIS